MNDLISRQDAIDLIDGLETKRLRGEIELMFAPAISGLMSLPSAQQWIPCSERLPEENGFYLVSVGAVRNPIRVYEYKPCKSHGKENLWKGSDISYCFNWFVEAWMPLPEPWKGGTDD